MNKKLASIAFIGISAYPPILPGQSSAPCMVSNSTEQQGIVYVINGAHAIRLVAPAQLSVSGVYLKTNLHTSYNVTDTTLDTAIFLANSKGTPRTTPARRGTMPVRKGLAKIFVTSFTPILIPRGSVFYIAFGHQRPNGSADAFLHLPSGPRRTSPIELYYWRPLLSTNSNWGRGPSDSVWK